MEFGKNKLPMPVLAFGGSSAVGERLKEAMESLAEHVEGGVIENCGHYVMEEQPEVVADALMQFIERVKVGR